MKNLLKEKIARGEKGLGIFYELGGNAPAQCIGIAGMDFFIIDSEHGPAGVEEAMLAIAAADKYPTTPFVRVPDSTRTSVLKMLDVGAQGIIVPNVQSVEEAKNLVKYAKYFPVGSRGFAPTIASEYGNADFAVTMAKQFATCNAETLLVPQCETRGCLEHIEEIVALDGIDGIFIGPYDLSIALGRPGEMATDEFKAAVARVLKACKDYGKMSFIYTGTSAASRERFAEGFDCVTCGMDAIFLVDALKKLVAESKAGC